MDRNTLRTQAYTMTMQDSLHYYVISLGRLFTKWPAALITWAAFIGLPATFALPGLISGNYVQAAESALPLPLVWITIIPVMGLWRTYRTVKKSSALRGPCIAAIDERQFSMEGETFAIHQQWSNFSELIETRGKIFFVLRGAGSAFPVRKDAFSDKAALAAFIRAARLYIAVARHAQVRVFEDSLITEPVEGIVSPPFTLTFIRFTIYHLLLLYRAFLRPLPFIVLFGGFTGMSLWYGRYALMAGDWFPLVLGLGAALGFMVIFSPPMVLFSWLISRRMPMAKGPRTVSISTTGVKARGESFDTTVQWETVRAINRRFGMLLFWSMPNAAVLVPLSAFADKAAAKAFQDQAVAWWRAAKSSAAQ